MLCKVDLDVCMSDSVALLLPLRLGLSNRIVRSCTNEHESPPTTLRPSLIRIIPEVSWILPYGSKYSRAPKPEGFSSCRCMVRRGAMATRRRISSPPLSSTLVVPHLPYHRYSPISSAPRIIFARRVVATHSTQCPEERDSCCFVTRSPRSNTTKGIRHGGSCKNNGSFDREYPLLPTPIPRKTGGQRSVSCCLCTSPLPDLCTNSAGLSGMEGSGRRRSAL